ncbi:MAG: TetR family transcriptional regulator [Bacteroidetes bacterium]|nr:TetR family transcriptional regulator [Bacteroidota bacterium]
MNIPKQEPNHLLEKTVSLFLRYGVRSVSMDDVAREAGVSKKTIYQHHGDRNGLVMDAVRYHLSNMEYSCSSIYNEYENPIEQLLNVSRYFHDQHRQTSPNLFYDLKKYFPETWAMIQNYRENTMIDQVRRNLEKGIQLGYYRPEVQVSIISRVYSGIIDMIMDDVLFPKTEYSFKDLRREVLIYHIHGICTPKGINHLNEIINQS